MRKFLIIAGEASGDVYGGMLVRAIRNVYPDIKFVGIGGPMMRGEGVEVVENAESLGVVGIFEVFEKIQTIKNAYFKVKKILKEEKIDGVILIDFPDFNFRVGKFAMRRGIKVFYFVIPQVWAWRSYRIKTMKKFVHKCVPIIPFEIELLKNHGIDATYTGHPLLDVSIPDAESAKIREQLHIPENSRVIALFPGSRTREVTVHLQIMLESANLIYREDRNTYFIISCAPTIREELLKSFAKDYAFPWQVTNESAANILSIAHSGIAVSGTIALEGAIAQKPLIIIYKLNTLSYYLVKPFVKIKYISLPNLILDKPIYPELIQSNLTVENLYRTFIEISEEKRYNEIISDLKRVKSMLGEPGVFNRIAEVFVNSMVNA
jgi:lipid-A-disaccharide synthase